MAWLSLLLFLPWFVLISAVFWCFPRTPRTTRRRCVDLISLAIALLASIAAMRWGHASGLRDPAAGAIWPQVLAVLYAYGGFLAVMALAVWLRRRLW